MQQSSVSSVLQNGHLGAMTPESKYFMVANLLAGVPRDALVDAHALVAWPGIVLDAAVTDACQEWNSNIGDYLLVAGYHLQDVAEKHFSLEALDRTYEFYRGFGSVHTQILARHAGHQAEWVANMVAEFDIKSVALFVPNFHLPRAYLTTIEALRRVGKRIPIIPVVPPLSPFQRCVLDTSPGGTRSLTPMDVIHAEVTRMETYSRPKADGSPGDVATVEAFLEYFEWFYQADMLQPFLMNGQVE